MTSSAFSLLLDIAVMVMCSFIALYFWGKYKVTKQRSALNAIPGLCTSLGILGTFVSICFTINGLEPSNNDFMKDLLNSVAPAFVTSIIGSSFAIISTFFIKNHFATDDALEEVH